MSVRDHVKVRIEGRDFVDLRHGQAHFLGQRRQVCRRQFAVAVLYEVQILDEKIPLPRPVLEQRADRVPRRRLHLAALRRPSGAPASGARVLAPFDLLGVLGHCYLVFSYCSAPRTRGAAPTV